MGTAEDGLVGKEIAGYTITERIGSGATGVVYRAEKEDREVAFKALNQAVANLDTLRRRFQREARALTKLDHPNVVAIDDFGVVDDVVYIAMELLDGETLEEALQDEPLEPARAVEVMKEVLAGVAFAHEREIVHRDLKPANVFLPKEGEVRVLDFGLAKFLSIDELSREGTLTRRGRVVGTPAYMAPEQITGASLDVRADVYAAGTVLYELLADRRPFAYERRSKLLRAHLFEPAPPLASVRPGLVVDEDLEEVVQRALAKDPAERWKDAGAMLEALEPFGPDSVRFDGDGGRTTQRSSSDTQSVVLTNEERMEIVREDARRAKGAEDSDGDGDGDGDGDADADAGADADADADVPRAESRWLTVAVWVVGLVALVGLYALGAYATTIR